MEKFLTNVPIFGQRDSRWANQRLGTVNGTTIGSHGCVITSLSMLAGYYGHGVFPNELDDIFTNRNLYVQGNLVAMNNITKVYPDILWQGNQDFYNTPAPIDSIRREIDERRPCFVWVYNNGIEHCMVAVGYKDNQIVVHDPWVGDKVSILDRWGDSAQEIIHVNYFKSSIPSPTPIPPTPTPPPVVKKLICLQAGHENTPNNCDPALRKGTGAPGEVEFTVRIRNKLSEVLQSKGFAIQLVDATANCKPEVIKKDFALFLAIHYDANIYGTGGGIVGAPDPSIDSSNTESKRIRDSIISEYFKNTGIVNHPERINGNITFYYMWKFLSAKTPCVLIECGVGQDAHDKVILNDTDRVVNGIARGICKAFNVPFDPVAPPLNDSQKVEAAKKIIYGSGNDSEKISKLKGVF